MNDILTQPEAESMFGMIRKSLAASTPLSIRVDRLKASHEALRAEVTRLTKERDFLLAAYQASKAFVTETFGPFDFTAFTTARRAANVANEQVEMLFRGEAVELVAVGEAKAQLVALQRDSAARELVISRAILRWRDCDRDNSDDTMQAYTDMLDLVVIPGNLAEEAQALREQAESAEVAQRSATAWEEDARRYAKDSDFWRERAEVAESERDSWKGTAENLTGETAALHKESAMLQDLYYRQSGEVDSLRAQAERAEVWRKLAEEAVPWMQMFSKTLGLSENDKVVLEGWLAAYRLRAAQQAQEEAT